LIVVLPSCRREVEKLPDDVRGDLADALARLDAGLSLAMPLSRHAGYTATQHGPRPAAAEGGDRMTKKTTSDQLSRMLAIPKSRALEATLKAQLIAAVSREVARQGLTHGELAQRSGLPRSAVTGILAGSLQRVTIDRLLRLVEAAGLEAAIRIRRAA
jgi:predicted XRE-type DNA-binding protein